MTFNIYSVDTNDEGQALYEIVLGDHKESAPLITTRWAKEMYEKQWLEALSALIEGGVKSCLLVTDIQPIATSAGITYWAIFREEDTVYFQQRWIMNSADSLIGSPSEVEKFIKPRIQGTPEEHSRVSEWGLPLKCLQEFVQMPH